MKQLSKRVLAALLAVLMGLSLLPQTVLALDPGQRQAERREGYNVATVSGGHSTYANGGVGGVIGRDMKRSGAQVENVYYLDSSCANASTSGADERVTAVSAANCWPGVR